MHATRAAHGPAEDAPGRTFFRRCLWALVWPEPRHRTVVTVPGVVLVALSLGVGTAAYNSSSNILFIALSMLLACLILSGVVAWINLRGVGWRFEGVRAFRAGLPGTVAVRVAHTRRLLPAYALWFEFEAREEPDGAGAPVSTFTARGIDVRAALARASGLIERGRSALGTRLDPGASARVDWGFTPKRRGLVRIRLRGFGSFFPFGFLGKFAAGDAGIRACVWPARIPYRTTSAGAGWRRAGGESLSSPGAGGDPVLVRRYQAGDSHRLIHWKATARARQVMVRQFSAQAVDRLRLEVPTDPGLWPDPVRFERMLELAGSLAEDLFRQGRMAGARISDGRGGARDFPMRRTADLDDFLDALAGAGPGRAGEAGRPAAVGGALRGPARAASESGGLLVLRPEGPGGVCASIDGQPLFTT